MTETTQGSEARRPLRRVRLLLVLFVAGLLISGTYQDYPFMAYGTDWLAFAHIVIAVAFWGPIRDPVRNVWVIEFGMIACALVIPMTLIAGPIRGIPFGWQLIDTSFGIVGIIPLWLARRTIRRIMQMPGALTRDEPARTDLNLGPGT